MTNATLSARRYPLGTLGLTLMVVVGRLVELETSDAAGASRWTRRALARAGLGGVSLIGAVVDGTAWTHPSRRASAPVPHPEPSRLRDVHRQPAA